MDEKAKWLDITRVCGRIFTSRILYTYLIICYSDLHRQLLRMCSTMVVAVCIFNKLQAAGLFLTLDGTSMRIDPSTNGRKYREFVINAVLHDDIMYEGWGKTLAAGHRIISLLHGKANRLHA